MVCIEKSCVRDVLVAAATIAGCVALILVAVSIFVEPLQNGRATVIGYSVKKRPLRCISFGNGPGGVLFLASIHGSEGAGTPLLEKLTSHLEMHPEQWSDDSVQIVATANPDGLASNYRFNARGVDLNRNFPADNRRNRERYGLNALSEPESRALYELIESHQPRVMVSIHQPIACVDYDGPDSAQMLAQRMSALCDLPVKKLGSRPGSLGAYFGELLGRPIITLELPRFASHDPEKLWKRYGTALLAALEH